MVMKVLDLFSGIGGFSLGLEGAGMETVAFCEKDSFCRKVLAQHWPNVPIHKDIRDLDGQSFRGTVDVVCGGFPCQPFSVAGLRQGKDDDRHLWPEMLRVVRECQPRWVIGENVSGFIRMALDDVCADLEREGYEVRTFVLPACAVDARHRRDRVWIVAHSDELRLEEHGHCEPTPFVQAGQRPRSVAHPYNQGLQRREESRDARGQGPTADQQSSRLGEFSSGGDWPVEPDPLRRMAHGVPNRVDRIKALGNSVVPRLVEVIGKIVVSLDESYGTLDETQQTDN